MARRGELLELCVLGLLSAEPQHGYRLRRQVDGLLARGRVLSWGSLYPCLARLTRAGDLVTRDEPDPAADEPPAGRAAARRRGRIVYALTDRGQERLAGLLSEPGPGAAEDEEFAVRFSLFSLSTPAARLRVLESRRTRLAERLAELDDGAERPPRPSGIGLARPDPWARELRRHGCEWARNEVAWLGGLIDAERSGTAPDRAAPHRTTSTTSPHTTTN